MKNTPPGPGVDASGQTVIDPTKNVEALVRAEAKRQDQLRKANTEALRDQMKALEHSISTERKHNKSLHKMETRLSEAESKRIDAIRAVDVGAVAVANTAAENRASTLAGQVNAAKDAQLVALKAETDPIRKDIGDLRQSQWTIAGGRQQGVESKGNWGMWIGLGLAAAGIVSTAILGVIGIIITLMVKFL